MRIVKANKSVSDIAHVEGISAISKINDMFNESKNDVVLYETIHGFVAKIEASFPTLSPLAWQLDQNKLNAISKMKSVRDLIASSDGGINIYLYRYRSEFTS